MSTLRSLFTLQRRRAIALGLVIWIGATVLGALGWLRPLESHLTDWRFRVRGARPSPPQVVCVAIDNESLAEIGDWPWAWGPETLARLVERLTAHDAKVIALDLIELARTPEQSVAQEPPDEPLAHLARACRAHGAVVLPLNLGERVRDPSRPRWVSPVGPPPVLREAATVGFLNIVPDLDGVVRTVPLLAESARRPRLSFACEAARLWLGAPPDQVLFRPDGGLSLGDREVPTDPAGELAVNFLGPHRQFPYVHAADVLRDQGDLDAAVGGKVVVVGKAATGAADLVRTPLSTPHALGLELQATVIANLVTGDFLREVPVWISTLVALLLMLLCAWIIPATRPVPGALAGLAIVAGLLLLSVALFFADVLLPTAVPLFSSLLTGLLLVGISVATLDRHRAREESRVNTLVGVGNILGSTLSRRELLRSIMQWVNDELEVEASSLLLLDEARKVLTFEIALGPKGEEVMDFEIPLGHGIAGYVAESSESVVVPDVHRDPRWAQEYSDAIAFQTRSIICVPMRVQERTIGVIEGINKLGPEPFGPADEHLLAAIAGQAAVLIENLKLYEELKHRVDFANEELVSANRELATEKRRIEAIVDAMGDGLIGMDANGTVVRVNPAAEELLGIVERQALGRHVLAVVEDRDLAQLLVESVAEHGGPIAREIPLGGPDERVVRAQTALVEDEDGVVGKVCVLTDITQLKELDRMKTDLVSFVSHELKNPLTSVKGFTSLLEDDLHNHPVGGDTPQYVQLIGRQVERMQRLVVDFLNVARLESGRKLEMHWEAVTDLPEIIQEIIVFEQRSTDRHALRTDLPPDLPPLRADRDKLYQILVNLVNNAVKYSPMGGEVCISARAGEAELTLSVQDHGVGLSPENMQHLFQKYRRERTALTQRVAGTGLGLYLTKQLVEAHGGRIWAEGEAGKGATFSLALPLRGDESDPGSAAPSGARSERRPSRSAERKQ